MAKKNNILILGYGEMGHAMEHLLDDHCHLHIWEKYPQDNKPFARLEEVATYADIILFCLPVNPHQQIANLIAPLLKADCLCLSIAKGLDQAGKTAAQIFADEFVEHQAYGTLYGPMISEEIRANRYAFAQIACSQIDAYSTVKKLFNDTRLYIESTPDITGISWSVILKNVYALAFGMADELQFGDNMRGFLAATALQELNEIVRSMGGQEGSPYHLAGLGDLITTATSEDSHHHELGRMLARGESQKIAGEGIHTLEMLDKYHLINTANYPLFNLIHCIVKEPQQVQKQFDVYLRNKYL